MNLPNQIISPITGDILNLTPVANGEIYVAQELGDSTEAFDTDIAWYHNDQTKENIYVSK